jgi:hypothetical protein
VHRAAAVNNQPLDKLDKAAAVNSRLLDREVAAAVNRVPQGRAPAVAAAVAALKVAAAVAAVVAAVQLTLPRQAPETFARFFLIGAGIWACCAAIRKST